jgi:hypothetical protein
VLGFVQGIWYNHGWPQGMQVHQNMETKMLGKKEGIVLKDIKILVFVVYNKHATI